MAKVLFGWEFGASLGHIYPLLRIADVLKAKGHDILFACRDVTQCYDVVKKHGYSMIQAPYWKNPPIANVRGVATPSYADVIARQGFGYPEILRTMMSAWDDLVTIAKPDLIVADHSPGLNLAIGGRVPIINIGNGFTLPPASLKEYPPVITTGKPLVNQQRLLVLFNKLRREKGLKPYRYLPEVFNSEGQFACTLPQLDPYDGLREVPVCGPLEVSLEPAKLPEDDHIFLYMANEAADSEILLNVLQKSAVPTTAYIRGASPERTQRYHSEHLKMLEKPVDFARMLPKVSLVLHSGGGGTATSCLMTGRPQIMFPRQSESNLSARLIKAQGLGDRVPSGANEAEISAIINGALGNHDMKQRCADISIRLSKGDWKQAIEKITICAEDILLST
ncbi:glycosyltransferase [Sneathiella aquimaris]|uniref:glycosyltransferase n=1 Tax=Sneathiella aquimaris TaxID=2599305 RepID=UPI00146B6A92|nr:hypothetical protein [Sneathiella aquimaris]